jgi:hypothetical protein
LDKFIARFNVAYIIHAGILLLDGKKDAVLFITNSVKGTNPAGGRIHPVSN